MAILRSYSVFLVIFHVHIIKHVCFTLVNVSFYYRSVSAKNLMVREKIIFFPTPAQLHVEARPALLQVP